MTHYYGRYGDSDDVDEENFDEVVKTLMEALRTEEFEKPDDEHTQVSISNEHWVVTAQVSGLVTFDNQDLLFGGKSDLPEVMFLRDIPDAELKKIWLAVVQVKPDDLLESSWELSLEKLPEYTSDFYRK